MTTENTQLKHYLSQAKGDSVLAETLRDAANNPSIVHVMQVQDMINDNAPVMLEILGEDGYKFFKNYQTNNSSSLTEDEGVE